MYERLHSKIKMLAGCEYLYFETALTIKTSPWATPFHAWAACSGPDGKVYVMNADEMWFEVAPREFILVMSLLQRVNIISKQLTPAA